MIRLLSQLFRLPLSLLNGVTALGGVCLFPAPLHAATLLAAFCGVTLLAMGGSAFNQLLERDIDALMTRTRLRPLPQGHLSAAAAARAGACTVLAGLLLLAASGSLLPPLLGLAALFWYLAVYTPLKRKTTMALPLGALCGALPPLIGWCMAGGVPTDYRIITLAGVLFIWQIPHFWLLQERHEADYRLVGVPLFDYRTIGSGRISLFHLWLTALTAATLILASVGVIEQQAPYWLLLTILISPAVIALCLKQLLLPAFSLFPLVLTAILILQRII